MAKKFTTGLVTSVLLAVVLLIMLLTALSETSDDVGAAAGNMSQDLNATGYCDAGSNCGAATWPLANFFKKKGVVLLAFIAGIVILVVKGFLAKGGK